jgi:hypothetical protein
VWEVAGGSNEKANLIGALEIKLDGEGAYSDQDDASYHELSKQSSERLWIWPREEMK